MTSKMENVARFGKDDARFDEDGSGLEDDDTGSGKDDSRPKARKKYLHLMNPHHHAPMDLMMGTMGGD